MPSGALEVSTTTMLIQKKLNTKAKDVFNKKSQMTLMLGTVCIEMEMEQLLLDIKSLCDWSVDWQMLFNADNCKTLHFEYSNVQNK